MVQLTNSTGDVTKTYDYDGFGVEKNTDTNDTNVFRYCGEYFDKETGTVYLRARYYNPSVGRFISEDSVWGKDKDPLSLNLYTYCYNQPIDYFDPSGHIRDYYDANGNYHDLDAEEFGKNSETYSTLLGLTNKWNSTNSTFWQTYYLHTYFQP